MKKLEELEKRFKDMEAGLAFHGKLIVGNIAAINLIAEGLWNHERRLVKLGSKLEDGEEAD